MEVTNWLKYWRDALITRERLAVDEKVLWGATTCERADALNGILQDQDTIRELKNLGRDAASGVGQRLILAPYVWSQPAQSGRPSTAYPTLVASVAVPAILDSNGELAPDPAAYPYIPRALLTPSLAALTVGSMDDWDDFVTQHPELPTIPTWAELIDRVNLIIDNFAFSEVFSGEPEYELLDKAFIIAGARQSPTKDAIQLYDRLLSDKPDSLKRLARFLPSAEVPLLELRNSLRERLSDAERHLGQMSREHPLSPSQRQALKHYLSNPECALAINGPPGTGKTFLLQSFISNGVVRSALEKLDQPPVTLAVASSNQAITNIIDSFDRVEHEDTDPFDKWWITGVRSFALYLPSDSVYNSRGEDGEKARKIYQSVQVDSSIGFFEDLQKPSGLDQLEASFLDAAQRAMKIDSDVSLKGVADCIYDLLDTTARLLIQGLQLAGQVESSKRGIARFTGELEQPKRDHQVQQGSLEQDVAVASLSLERAQKLLGQVEQKLAHRQDQLEIWNCRDRDNSILERLLDRLPIIGRRRLLTRARTFVTEQAIDTTLVIDVKGRFSVEKLEAFLRVALKGARQEWQSVEAEQLGIKLNFETLTKNLNTFQQLAAEKEREIDGKINALANARSRLVAWIKDLLAHFDQWHLGTKLCSPERIYREWLNPIADRTCGDDLVLDAIERLADITLRSWLFRIAVHYWEARWLVSTKKALKRFKGFASRERRSTTNGRFRGCAKTVGDGTPC